MTLQIDNGDCLELMKKLPDKSVDLFICDLPYGETNCKWDCKIDLDEFWSEFRRLRKSKRTACIHFCSSKFGYTLIKSWEKGFKMDMVWKKRNKTGGLQSRNRPMRNHEMVYFFYEQAPKYNRDKYHKRIAVKNDTINGAVGNITNAGNPEGASNFSNGKNGKFFEPPNPASVVEEKDPWGCKNGGDKGAPFGLKYDPPNPASVVEEKKNPEEVWGWNFKDKEKHLKKYGERGKEGFEPKLPVSVVEELIEPAEDEPKSMFESTKVFIGKRHHQTEKPQDILEFFLKYWSDEGETILDPTMGSGSTGVACKKLNRNFIGYELDEKIFEVAKKRLDQ
jgi:DNA modification methylase